MLVRDLAFERVSCCHLTSCFDSSSNATASCRVSPARRCGAPHRSLLHDINFTDIVASVHCARAHRRRRGPRRRCGGGGALATKSVRAQQNGVLCSARAPDATRTPPSGHQHARRAQRRRGGHVGARDLAPAAAAARWRRATRVVRRPNSLLFVSTALPARRSLSRARRPCTASNLSRRDHQRRGERRSALVPNAPAAAQSAAARRAKSGASFANFASSTATRTLARAASFAPRAPPPARRLYDAIAAPTDSIKHKFLVLMNVESQGRRR